MEAWLIAVLVVIGVALLLTIILVTWWITTYNKLIRLENDIDESYSTMDVYMKKRYDLIPNLVETVKGYVKHEKNVLEDVMKARYSCMTANSPEDKAKNEGLLAGTLKSLFAVAENYPTLQANKNFVELMNSLQNIETEIANSRKYYNGSVKLYNNKKETFPSNIVAKHYNFKDRVLFELSSLEERKTPKVEF